MRPHARELVLPIGGEAPDSRPVFVRELETKRYTRAQSYLSEELAAKTGPATLKELTERLLQRTGKILDVRGEAGWIASARAEAGARLKTELMGEPMLKFSLTRRAGVWSINDLQSIEAAAMH